MRSASRSDGVELLDGLDNAQRDLEQIVATLNQTANPAVIAEHLDQIQSIVSSTTRLYAYCAERIGPCPPLQQDVSTTAAIELAAALFKARDLNPFDLALWFSR